MAIKLTFTDDSTGMVYVDSYHKICAIFDNKDAQDAKLVIKIYKDSDARLANKNPLVIYDYVCSSENYDEFLSLVAIEEAATLDSRNNMYSQTYNFLRTQETPYCKYNYKNEGINV